MRKKSIILLFWVVVSTLLIQFVWKSSDEEFVSYSANPKKETLRFYYKDDKQTNFQNLNNLKQWLNVKNTELVFAMNGGMYKKDKSPQGLYIENEIIKAPLDTVAGEGNFYLKPNGVFYLTTKNEAKVATTETFINNKNVKFATQSGPMLVSDGKIHKAFNASSTNLNIRNGVGILPDGQVLFAMSKKEINFYNFASFFKEKGCENALYLDGFVSRMYCPSQNWIQTDGDFGVIIAVTKNK
jgi:uncharacterized protein YigE (DUF2233 family)